MKFCIVNISVRNRTDRLSEKYSPVGEMGMFSNPIAILCICIVARVKTKNLHMKETNAELDDDVNLQDMINYNDPYYTVQDRFARHVELVTESVLEHLLKEINKKYSDNATAIPKIMQRLKMKLKSQINKKKRFKKKSHKYGNSTTLTIDKP